MSAQEQVERLRTLQESMHEIADKVVSLGDGSVMLNDVAEGKKQISNAINTKGGNSTPDESFQQLADDIESLPYAGISAEGIVQTEPFEFLKYITNQINEEITEIEDNGITSITREYAFAYNTKLKKIKLSKLATITSTHTFIGCTSLEEVVVPRLQNISNYCFSETPLLKIYNLPSCVKVASDSFRVVTPYNIVFGQLIEIVVSWNRSMSSNYLRNITIGQDTDVDLPFQNWKATNVIAEGQSGIDELNNNLRTNLLEKLADHSTDGQTRTLRLGWLAHVTQENIDYANSKGWTLTT